MSRANFNIAMRIVGRNEGGYTPNDGGSGYPAVYGINKKWWPAQFNEAMRIRGRDGDAAGKAYAKDFYKDQYYDKYGLDRFELRTQTVLLDGVINHRIRFVGSMVDAALRGADHNDILSMRRAEYAMLAGRHTRHAKNLEGWNNRLDKVAKYITRISDGGRAVPIYAAIKNPPIPTSRPADAPKALNDSIRVVIDGDSNMHAVAHMNGHRKDLNIINAAKDGARGAGDNERAYPSDIQKGDKVLVGYGANDALNSDDIASFETALEARVTFLQGKGASVTLVNFQFHENHPKHELSEKFNDAIERVAFKTGATLFDVSTLNAEHKGVNNVHFKDSEYPQILDKALTQAKAVTAITPIEVAKLEPIDGATIKDTQEIPIPKFRAPLEPIDGTPITAELSDGKVLPNYRPAAFSRSISTDTGKQPIAAVSGEVKAKFGDVTNYTFKPGESVSVYAQRNGLDKGELGAYSSRFADLNNLKTANLVIAGRSYKMPKVGEKTKGTQPPLKGEKLGHQMQGDQTITVTIEKGNTLSGIFQKLGIENPLQSSIKFAKESGINPRTLKIGAELQIDKSQFTTAPVLH